MAIDQISLSSGGFSNPLISRVFGGGRGAATEAVRKSFGEPIPKMVDIRNSAFLMALFSQLGVLGRLQRKLSILSRKRGRLVPAKGTVACALAASEETGHEDLVFVGVEFASEYHEEEETLAGVLAHEWGHLVSEFPKGMDPDRMSWEEIFALRKEEEAAADSFAGKMLHLMRYSPEGLIRFLSTPGTHSRNEHFSGKESSKYHSVATRARIVRASHENAERQERQTRNLGMLFKPGSASNPFGARLIAVA